MSWTPFDRRRVVVTGERWTLEPYAQQVDAPHFRVATLALAGGPSPDAPLVSVGAEQQIPGVVETLAGEPGTKEEGSTWAAFTGGGATWRIWDSPADLPADTAIVVTARAVEISTQTASATHATSTPTASTTSKRPSPAAAAATSRPRQRCPCCGSSRCSPPASLTPLSSRRYRRSV